MATRSFIAIYKLGNLVVGAETFNGCCEPQCKIIQSIAFPKFTGIETGSKVAIELSSSDLVVQTCDNGIRTIEGLVTSATQAIDAFGCKKAQFALTISYDDAQLVDPTTPLVYNADSIGSGNVLTITILSPADQWIQQIIECINAVTLPIDLATDVSGILPFVNLPVLSKVADYSNESAAVSTASNALAILSGASVSLTVAAGESVVIEASCTMSAGDLTSRAEFTLAENGVPVGSVVQAVTPTAGTNGDMRTISLKTILTAPAVGLATYSLQWRRVSGSDTIYGRFPQLIAYTLKTS